MYAEQLDGNGNHGASALETNRWRFAVTAPAVPSYDPLIHAVAQMVSFDLEPGKTTKTLSVLVPQGPEILNAQETRPVPTRLRYIGFEHRGNTRAYLFAGLSPGSERRTFTVTTDLALFTKHHIGIQEGPALCLQLLAAELDVADAAAPRSFRFSLTDREMLAHLASRLVPGAKCGSRGVPQTAGGPRSPHDPAQ